RRRDAIAHRRFYELPELLQPGDLLVRNDARVRRARLYGRDAEGRLVEVFLLRRLDEGGRRWRALAKPGRRAKLGREIHFEECLRAEVESVEPGGGRIVRFDRAVDDALLERIGRTPLPPYIRREPGAPDLPEDREGYQTLYARQPLAVAAPTAGLHFTPEILARIARRGVQVADLTLAVGAGSFKPVTVEDTSEHAIPPEDVTIPAATAAAVRSARSEGRRVVAVGTTVARSLEAAMRLPQALSA